jgi:hypothetical protein
MLDDFVAWVMLTSVALGLRIHLDSSERKSSSNEAFGAQSLFA